MGIREALVGRGDSAGDRTGPLGPAKRPPLALSAYPSLPARFLDGGRTGDLLRAEHGFSCLVTITKSERTVRILFDAGLTPDGLVENMRRLGMAQWGGSGLTGIPRPCVARRPKGHPGPRKRRLSGGSS